MADQVCSSPDHGDLVDHCPYHKSSRILSQPELKSLDELAVSLDHNFQDLLSHFTKSSKAKIMHGQYVDPLFRILYPPNWQMDEAGDELARSVEIESPDKLAYIQISIHSDRNADELLQEALAVMMAEYEGLHSEAIEASIDGQSAEGFDLEFVSLDFPIGGLLRAIDSPDGGLLIQGQWSNVEVHDSNVSYGDVIAAIMTSLELSYTYDED